MAKVDNSSASRAARIGLSVSVGVLLFAGVAAAFTVEPAADNGASSSELARLRNAAAAVRSESQLRVVQEMSAPGGTTMDCAVVRPATRCEQKLPTGATQLYVTSPEGFFYWVPEARRAQTAGKEWVRVEGQQGGSATMADGFASVLGSAKSATVRRNVPMAGVLTTHYRFSIPKQDVPTAGAEAAGMTMPDDLEVASVVEAWIDDRARPLKIVNRMAMTSATFSSTMVMTTTYSYGPVDPFPTPPPDAAFPVATAREAALIITT